MLQARYNIKSAAEREEEEAGSTSPRVVNESVSPNKDAPNILSYF